MAKPNKKGPSKTVDIYCAQCQTLLLKYRKGGKGTLVKCFKERISQNFTNVACQCPSCKKEFAREAIIRGVPALKIIGGKVRVK